MSKKTKVSQQDMEEDPKEVKSGTLAKFNKKPVWMSLVLVGLILATTYSFKGVFIAATVNGSPISRLNIVQQLEKQGGKNALDALVTDKLIENAAKKKGIVISDDEINQEIKTIEATVTQQGGTLEQALMQQGMTKENLKGNIKNQKIIEKLLADKLKVTDAEVTKYIADNENTITEGQEAETKKQIMDQLKQEKFQKEAQALVTSLKTAASIKYYVTY